jgi:hypothetical protein
MGEQRINRISVEDLPVPERKITPQEAKKIFGGAEKAPKREQEAASKKSQEREQKTRP